MIGVFDSGVGGLSVLREIRFEMPDVDLLYVADQGRAPYGPRELGEVQEFSHEITDWLIDRGATTLVVACNTASAAALEDLRLAHPNLPIVGMEPAVKPAASITNTGVIAVFATAATFQGRLFESVVNRFTGGVTVITKACPGWVEVVERGEIEGEEVETLITPDVADALDRGADTLVLGCTHFSFLGPSIEKLAGPGITLIDPAQPVAAQTARVAKTNGGSGGLTLATSGDTDRLRKFASELGGFDIERVEVFP